MSDGERVWVVGRTLDASGDEALTAPWHAPKEVLALPEGVRALEAGSHASAVVGAHGDLHMWGRLLDYTHADSLLRRYGLIGSGRSAHAGHLGGGVSPDDVRWQWAGFGGPAPRRVDGLPGTVRGVALGGWHALVALD